MSWSMVSRSPRPTVLRMSASGGWGSPSSPSIAWAQATIVATESMSVPSQSKTRSLNGVGGRDIGHPSRAPSSSQTEARSTIRRALSSRGGFRVLLPGSVLPEGEQEIDGEKDQRDEGEGRGFGVGIQLEPGRGTELFEISPQGLVGFLRLLRQRREPPGEAGESQGRRRKRGLQGWTCTGRALVGLGTA